MAQRWTHTYFQIQFHFLKIQTFLLLYCCYWPSSMLVVGIQMQDNKMEKFWVNS